MCRLIQKIKLNNHAQVTFAMFRKIKGIKRMDHTRMLFATGVPSGLVTKHKSSQGISHLILALFVLICSPELIVYNYNNSV